MAKVDIEALRRAVRENRYVITTHARKRMGDRGIHEAEVLAVLSVGAVVEEYRNNLPDPKVLLMAEIGGEPLYVACAFDGRYVSIVTVHWYDREQWTNPWTRSKN